MSGLFCYQILSVFRRYSSKSFFSFYPSKVEKYFDFHDLPETVYDSVETFTKNVTD